VAPLRAQVRVRFLVCGPGNGLRSVLALPIILASYAVVYAIAPDELMR
jgi:hypothetical protein